MSEIATIIVVGIIILIAIIVFGIRILKSLPKQTNNANMESALSKATGKIDTIVTNLSTVISDLGSVKSATASNETNYDSMITKITNVERVFTTNQTRGDLGEYVVEQIIEWVGLKEGKGISWDKKKPSGKSIPDFTFYFPNKAYFHLDAKFPFNNYLEIIKCDPNSSEEESKKRVFKANVKAILDNIHKNREDYIEHDGGINFVMIFVPNMHVLDFVRREYDDLYNSASKKKMLLVGPSELYSILHVLRGAVENFKIEKSTKEIIDDMKKFQLEWGNMLLEFQKHDSQLTTAQKSFDEITGPRKRALEKIVDKIASSEVDKTDDTVKEE
ncbi:uncharacterized protein METZ01_LOCUS300158 [marine metagenome]|uniref:DNA recombination protein RmuC n=1 Tax=marine metagenome TaxID=408172 RepID=A0A382MED5_9ZZZZ|tara:strand:- start:27 stop:1016 length:990 start_codon:yes stop_codon:yes gene_type:complete